MFDTCMAIRRRQFLKTAVVGSSIASVAGCASLTGGGSYPSKPLDVVVPFGAGGGVDSIYRGFQPYIDEALPTNTVVDNRGGGGGRVGQRHWQSQEADGYTLFSSSGRTHFQLYPEYYDIDASPSDVAATGAIGMTPVAMISRPDAPWDDIAGMKQYTEENEFKVAGVGFATDNHAALLTFLDDAGLNLDNVSDVSLSGGQSLSQAVANSDIDAASVAFSGATGLAESGKVNVEAVLTEATELGGGEIKYPTVNTIDSVDLTPMGLAIELYAHADLEESRLSTLRDAHATALEKQEFKDWARKNFIVPSEMNGQEAQNWLETDAEEIVQRYKNLVDKLGMETP